MNKTLIIGSSILAVGLIVIAIMAGRVSDGINTDVPARNAVEVVDGIQIVTVQARGGYSPREIELQAGIPTLLKVETNGTYDCSAAFTIPSQNISRFLPPKGVAEFELPPQEAGTEMQGLCSMGMYGFVMRFE